MFVEVECHYRGAPGTVSVTDDRLIFVPDGEVEDDPHDIPITDISEVSSNVGRESSTLQVAGHTFEFESSEACLTIDSALRDLMDEGNPKACDPYQLPWYDSHGLMLVALFCLPLALSGWLDRNSLPETGRSKFWHHAGALWIFTLVILPAPVGLYGFVRRIRDDGRRPSHSDYLGAVLATLLTIAISFILI